MEQKIIDNKDGTKKYINYKNNKLLTRFTRKNEIMHGLYERWYESGEKHMEIFFEDGKVKKEIVFYPSGNVEILSEYIYDTDELLTREWWENGRQRSIKKTKNGQINGYETLWNFDGSIHSHIKYKNNRRDGFSQFWYPGNRIFRECEYKDGLMDGECKIFWENGNIQKYNKYKNGIKNGTCADYDENGKLISAIKYNDGAPAGPAIPDTGEY